MHECSLMVETYSGAMPVFAVRPRAGGSLPLVIMLMDGGGIREGLRDNARRLAAAGYAVMLPNLFHRSATTGPIEDLEDMERITALNTGLSNGDVVLDVDACIQSAGIDAGSGKIGLIGYCMGGRLSITVAQAMGERVSAVVSLHPGYMATRAATSPHLFLDNVKAKVFFGVA
jgi:carboxymethylenebutenolidase